MTGRIFPRIFIVSPVTRPHADQVQKWGSNSLGLRIPRSLAAEAQVEEGATVDLAVENGSFRVRRLRPRKYALSELLKEVAPRTLHGEVPTGKKVAREAW